MDDYLAGHTSVSVPSGFQQHFDVVDLVPTGDVSFFDGVFNLIVIKHFKVTQMGLNQYIRRVDDKINPGSGPA